MLTTPDRKLLMIDAKNLCHRVHWSHRNLFHQGKHVSVLFGFFKSLIGLKKNYADHLFVVAWDGGHDRRTRESNDGVAQGIIASAYKENRKRNEEPDENYQSLLDQMDELKQALALVRVFQVDMQGVEADDVIYSYTVKNSDRGGKTTIITSDKDFYQLLKLGVVLHDPLNSEVWTRQRFCQEFAFEPELWVDVGALQGDKGDNIHGVDGWGPVTAMKYVREHGGIDAVFDAVRSKSKRTKKEDVLLASEKKVRLAKSLKRMDFMPHVPKLRFTSTFESAPLEKFFLRYRFASLLKDIGRLL